MTRVASSALSILATFLCMSAMAQSDAGPTADYQACLRQPSTRAEQSRCSFEEMRRQDSTMWVEYKSLLDSLDRKQSRSGLENAQKAWVAFSAADCEAKAEAAPGFKAADTYQQCITEHTISRRNQLKNFLTSNAA